MRCKSQQILNGFASLLSLLLLLGKTYSTEAFLTGRLCGRSLWIAQVRLPDQNEIVFTASAVTNL